MRPETKKQIAEFIFKTYPKITCFTDVQILDIVKETKLDVKQIDGVLFYYRLDIDKLYMNTDISIEEYL